MKKLFTIVVLMMSLSSMGQDHHFSQFYATPLMSNPANTGDFDEDWRVSAIHRNQWSGINSAFVSTAVGLDLRFSGGFIGQDEAGVGVAFLKDQLGGDGFTSSAFLPSVAWHRKIDHQKRHKLSAGIQGGIVQKTLLNTGLQFENQYQNFQHDPNLPNNENIPGVSQNYLDLELGLGWTYLLSPETEIQSGVSVYQLTSPQENFTETVDSLFTPNELGNRLSITVGASHDLGNGLTLYPRILWMGQTKARNFNLGSSIGYEIKEDIELLGGLYTRFGDAAIAKVGLKYKNVTTRLSYDQTYSSLQEAKGAKGAGNSLGAWELSIIVVGRWKKDQINYTVPCGIF